MAFTPGAIERKQLFELPPLVSVLLRLAQAREINGMNAIDFCDLSF
jgi:hypothetical protein